MNRQFTILTCMMFIVSLSTLAQNQYHMSQFMLHQPFINPAAQGSYSNLNGALFYKTQWTNFVGAPEIAGFNINKPLDLGSLMLTYGKVWANRLLTT